MSWRTLVVVAVACVASCATRAVAAQVPVPVTGYDVPALRLYNCFADTSPSTRDDCNVSAYRYSLLAAALPAAVVAAAVCVFAVCYCCGKYVCNCCGGRRQSPNFCCPSNDLPAKYNKADLLRPLALAVVCTLLCAVALVWLCVSGARLQRSMAALDDDSTRTCGALTRGAAALTTSLRHVSYYDSTRLTVVEQSLLPPPSSSSALPGDDDASTSSGATATPGECYVLAHRDAVALLTQMRTATVAALRRDSTRFVVVLYVVAACAMLASVALTLFAFCNCRRCLPMMLLCVFCVLAALAWLCHGAFARTHMLVTDACREVDDAAATRAHALVGISACNDTALRAYARASRDVLDTFARETCRVLLPHCLVPTDSLASNVAAGRVLSCAFVTTASDVDSAAAAGDACARMTHPASTSHAWLPPSSAVHVSTDVLADATLQARVRAMGYTCTSSNNDNDNVCDLTRCATTCAMPDGSASTLTRRARDVVSRAAALHQLAMRVSVNASSLMSCGGVFAFVTPSLVSPCDDAVAASYAVRQSSGLLGLVTLASLFVCVWGAKRFIAMDQALVAQYDT